MMSMEVSEEGNGGKRWSQVMRMWKEQWQILVKARGTFWGNDWLIQTSPAYPDKSEPQINSPL